MTPETGVVCSPCRVVIARTTEINHANHNAKKLALAFVVGAFAVGPVFADKPEWAGKGKPDKGVRGDDDHRDKVRGSYFSEQHRREAREYYHERFRSGHCPPGLAKKWRRGKPLPSSVVYYDVPPSVVVRLGPPPAGHRFVRVASDILLIAVGTGMVIDAIEDLGK